MNKDTVVAEFEKSNDILDNEFHMIQSDYTKLPLAFSDINSWLERRRAAKHREHLKKLMAECDCLSSEGFIRVTHAASLNDSFWVKKDNEEIEWRQVSLYKNEFNEVISKISFEGNGLFGIEFSTTTPEFSTEGSFEKCWKRENDVIYLYKRGSSGARNAGREPYSEAYAAQIAKLLCKKYVDYEITTLHKRTASKCKLFTSEQEGFASFSSLYHQKVSPRKMLEFYAGIGCEEDFRRMIVFDAITFNVNRHHGNHGVIFNNDTLEICGMAPVFDYNQALLPYAEETDFENMEEYIKMVVPKIGEDFIAISKSLLTSEIRADLINMYGFQFECRDDEKFTAERVKSIEKIVNRQIAGILDKEKLYTVDVFKKPAAKEEQSLK